MTVTIHLTPELEATLVERARASSVPLEDYVLSLVEESTGAGSANHFAPSPDEAVRRMIEFGEKYRLDFGEPITRAGLHEGHRF